MSSPARVRLRASAVLLLLAASFGIAGTATPAEAATRGSRALTEATHHRGAPYQYGAAGPTRFDCSGFTRYVYGKVGVALAHNAAQQYSQVHHVAKGSQQYGDLLFFRNSSGRISHVAIYAGGDNMWHAPHSGDHVRLARIYSSNYLVGRP